MANNTVTLTGANSGLIFDGKKTLTVTKDYTAKTLTVPGSGNLAGYKEGKTAGETVDGSFAATKVGIITVEGSGSYDITGGSKSTSIYLGTGGGTVRGGDAGDKFYGNTGADTFVLGSKDAVGDAKAAGYNNKDTIVLEGASLSNLTFTDNISKKSVVITDTKSNGKVTIFKDDANTQLKIKADVEFNYGVDGTKTAVADSGKTLKINSANANEQISAATLLAGAKNIDATAVTRAIYLSGNAQNDNISIGSGGGTLYGGYNVKKGVKAATNDNLYGTGNASVTFYIDGDGGNDNIFNYKSGDIIKIDDGKSAVLSFDSKGTQKFKDGGTGKDVSFTYEGKKIAIKSNDAERIVFDVNGTLQAYGPSLASGLSVDSKRTALIVGANYADDSVEAENWTNGLTAGSNVVVDNNALKTYAPKLNTINATATTKAILLKAQDTIATVLQSGAQGSTMVGGTGADQFQGGAGADIYVVDLDNKKTTGKDVITAYDSNDIIMVRGLATSLENQVSVDTKGNVYFSTLKADQSKSAISVKNFKTAGTPVVVINEGGKVLAVNSTSGVPGPAGLNTTLKTGLQTDDKFTGKYNGAVVEGATYDISTKKYITTDIDSGVAVLDANTFGGTAKSVNATLVSDALRGTSTDSGLVIIGNASTKNTIYLPDIATAKNQNDLYVTVEGGSNNDTFIGHTTATATHAFYNISLAGKDVIENYNPDTDIIHLDGVTLSGIGNSGYLSTASDSRISEKNADVTFTVGKNTLTIKNGATKKITFQDAAGRTYTYGHTLPEGLAYDSKHTALNATGANPSVEGERADYIDLTETEPYSTVAGYGSEGYGGNYYTGIKTVSLSAAPASWTANKTSYPYTPVVIGNNIANEIYAAPGGTYLYGGDPGAKADADKLYGNDSVDAFVYKKGAGADVIGNTKAGNEKTLFDENDWLVIGSGNASALNVNDLTFTDKKGVLTITFNDDKASKLTVNKKDAGTAVRILFDNNSLSAYGHNNGTFAWNGYSGIDSDITSENTYFVYGVDTRTFRADATNIDKGTLVINGAGIEKVTVSGSISGPVDVTIGAAQEDGTTKSLPFAKVDAKYVSSALKNISVTNDDLVVSLTGGITALNVSMGAGGGTVEGGANGTKALNDKFYSKGNTTYVLSKATGGKDAIYNYNAANGDVLYFKDGAPSEVSFSAKSITFSYDGKKSTFTIYPPSGTTFDSSTSVKILYPVVSNNQTVTGGGTFYGWDAKQKSFSYYAGSVRDDQWTKSGDLFIFHGKNTSENTGLHGTNYTLQGSSILDDDSNYIPDYTPDYAGLNGAPATESISFGNDNATMKYIDPVFNGFHIKGTYQYNDGNPGTPSTLKAGDVISANGTTYTLANVDGNVENGYELTSNGWVKLADDSFAYLDPTKIYVETTNAKGNSSIGSKDSPFTITGALTDSTTPGEGNDVFSNLSFKYESSASELTIAVANSDVEISGAHVQLHSDFNKNISATNLFKNSNNFTVNTRIGNTSDGDTVGTYKLYAGDADTVNGYELLRTDLADAAHWTLETPDDTGSDAAKKARSSLQSGGVGFWQYSDTTADKSLVFEIGAAAGIKAQANGLPTGISVGSISGADTVNTTTIYFDDEAFNTANITLLADNEFGSGTGAVRVSGLAVGTQFTVGAGAASVVYSLAEFDGDSSNGYELLKANDKGWTYDAGAWKYDNTTILNYSSSTSPALAFTISATASLQANEDGTPKDVTVSSDTKGIFTIDFTGMSDAHVIGVEENQPLTGRSDTSLITFGNIQTGDVAKTVRIKGFDSDTASFVINGGSFYLADLDSDTDTAELLPVNTNWKRTATGWNYYADGVAAAAAATEENPVFATFSIDTLSNGTVIISADENGGPKGIKIEGNQFTIDERFGTISGATAKSETGVVSLTADMVTFGPGTAINSTGIHVLGTSSISSVQFGADKMVTVLGGEEGSTKLAFKLANLDRDASNGFELLTTDTTASWTFNNGVDDKGSVITAADSVLGSWTFASSTKVGNFEGGLKFSVSEAASLLAVDEVADDLEAVQKATIAAGNPGGIYVNVNAASSEATIYADRDVVASTQLIFDNRDTTKALFLSDTGVHVVGFEEGDLVTVQGEEIKDSKNKVTGYTTWQYRVKELNGNAEDGFELLKVSDTDVWALTSNEDNGYARDWTYTGNDLTLTVGHQTLAAAADAEPANAGFGGLYAHEDGRPINLEVVPGATATDTATIKVNQETSTTEEATLQAYSLTLTTTQVGSGTSVHIIGYDSDTTLSVNGSAYRLANMDGDTNTKELLAYNANWTYHDSDIQLKALSDTTQNQTYKAGTWMYSQTITESETSKTFQMALDSDVALRPNNKNEYVAFGKTGSSTGVAAADVNGAPIGVTVSGNSFAGLTLTFDASRLNIQEAKTVSGKTTTETTLFSHITLGSDTAIGKDGIHIVGFASDTTFKVGETDVYLAELDGKDNGLEILQTNAVGWKRTATGWDYASDTSGNGNIVLKFSVATTLDADETGAPIGITVNGGKTRENLTYSDTIVIDTSAIASADLITFADQTKAGSATGVHISLVGNDAAGWAESAAFQFASSTATTPSTYYMKELDGDTDTGYELLIANNAGWSLENGIDANAIKRIWTYTNTANGTISFTVNPKSSDQGLKADPVTGLPIGAAVVLDTIGSGKNGISGYWLNFSDSDGTAASTTLNIDSNQVVFDSVVTGVNGVHIKGLADSDTYAYTADSDTMFTVNGGQYYLANVNETKSNGNVETKNYYELLFNDPEWHRYETGWKYNDGASLSFTINSETTLMLVLPASTVTADEGKPFGITVSDLDDEGNVLINITTAAKVADALVFDSAVTSIDSYLHISLSSGNSGVDEFRVRKYGATSADDSDTTFYIVDADHNATNGKEFYMKDTESDTGVWVRTADGWDYFNSGATVNRANFTTVSDFAFRVNFSDKEQTGYGADDAGQSVPAGLTVASDSKIVTNAADSGFDISQFQLYVGRFSTDVASDTTEENPNSKVFNFSSPHFVGFAEGNTIGSYNSSTKKIDATYTLYNADGDSSNGLELTFNGWTSYESDDGTYHAYVRGTDADHTKNTGFAIKVDESKVLKYTATTLPGFVEGSANTFKFKSENKADQGVVLGQLTSGNFHVAQFSDVGVIAADKTIEIGDNTYRLKQLDTNANDFELTDSEGNWARTDSSHFYYVGTGSTTATFTLTANGNFDNTNDFKPDIVENISTENDRVIVNLNSTVTGLAFQFEGENSTTTATKVIVNYNDGVYTLKAGTSPSFTLAESVSAEGSGSQLAADDAQAWSGYEVEDLINYDGSVTTDSELDSILKVDEIGTAETFGTDPADLLTEVATKDKTLNALTNAARHRARK